MNVFCRVVELQSFSRAAKVFGISAAMVSKHIANLEDNLKTRLLHRTTRQVTPTSIGMLYYERCKTILSELEEAESSISDLTGRVSGVLKISAPMDFGRLFLMPVISKFLVEHADVGIDITFDDRHLNLIDEGLDMTVRIGQLHDSSLVAKKLATSRLIVCAAPHYLSQYGEPQNIQALSNHNCLSYSYSQKKNEWVFNNGKGKSESVLVSGSLTANNGIALKRSAIAGLGVIFQPDFIVSDALIKGELVEILPGSSQELMNIYGVYPHRRFISNKVRRFLEFVEHYFEQSNSNLLIKS
ncbi:MAG: LysR family transcriptional regulator [Gammaproteobacteria bacterium]|nr:LysR family transcriptional regulator [Gammaproteobacteria bacterium]